MKKPTDVPTMETVIKELAGKFFSVKAFVKPGKHTTGMITKHSKLTSGFEFTISFYKIEEIEEAITLLKSLEAEMEASL